MKMEIAIIFIIFCSFSNECHMETPRNKKLTVKEIEYKGEASLEEVSELLEKHTEPNRISVVNWDSFPYAPDVKFRMAYSHNDIWLKYYVTEENILAQHTDTNSAVSMDSCIEFFFDPVGDGNYYNFEFNCIGTTHLAYGPNRHNREYVDSSLIQKYVKTASTLGDRAFAEKTGGHTWEITIIIPSKVLNHNKGITLKGLNAKSNFYKCGDGTSRKHYLTWNPIETEKPDYHRPEYFGDLFFE